MVRDRGNWLKTQPVVYSWTNGAGWVKPTSYEVMKMKVVNHKPMIYLREPSPFRAGRRSE
jgi:transposase